jgi:hypothetical protein
MNSHNFETLVYLVHLLLGAFILGGKAESWAAKQRALCTVKSNSEYEE